MNGLHKRLDKLETHSTTAQYDVISYDGTEKRFVDEQAKIKGARPQRADISGFCNILNNPQQPHCLNI